MSAFLPAKRPAFSHIRWTSASARSWMLGALIAGPAVLAACATMGRGAVASSEVRVTLAGAGAQRGQAHVACRDASAERRVGFITVVGSASNASARPLRDVEAVVELLDARGRVVGVETALVEMPQLGAGQASPFRVVARDPGRVDACRLRFRTLDGVPVG